MVKATAVLLTDGYLKDRLAKTAHGLLRGSDRFEIIAVIDPVHQGKRTQDLFDSRFTDVPVFADLPELLEKSNSKPVYCIVGVAPHGGILPGSLREVIRAAIMNGISIVSGLHSLLIDDPEFKRLSEEHQVELIDVRKPVALDNIQFWNGDNLAIPTPRIAILGMDCVIGKRTTGILLKKLCVERGIRAEFIYTGQTGWMQGLKHGFVFDATINDFISSELEKHILECYAEADPELIFIEGQSSLRNPSGPCGSEFILSGNCKAVILQHAPGRKYFDGMEEKKIIIPPVDEEIALIKMYGARTMAVTLNEENLTEGEIQRHQIELEARLGIPVIRPFNSELERLLPVLRSYIQQAWKY